MPITIAPFVSRQEIKAEDLNDVFHKCEDFLNGGIEDKDLQASMEVGGPTGGKVWCKTRHIVKPEFYGSPAPRVQMTTADVHYRKNLDARDIAIFTNDLTGDASEDTVLGASPLDFVAIPGLSTTIHIDVQSYETNTASVVVYCNFFAREREPYGSNGNSGLFDGTVTLLDASTSIEGETGICAKFALFHQVEGERPTVIDGTVRYQHWNFSGFAHKNHSISAMIPLLGRGIHHIYVGIKPTADVSNTEKFYQILVEERNMHAEVIYR
tara:strand:- start:560 stop:1363 length:804 start_codon:yes stop_codon:yes gene_type:complete